MENRISKIKPADRLASVSEYYFSKKLKEVAQMNAEGKDVISLGIGSPVRRAPYRRFARQRTIPTDTATSPMWAFPNCAAALPAGTKGGTGWN